MPGKTYMLLLRLEIGYYYVENFRELTFPDWENTASHYTRKVYKDSHWRKRLGRLCSLRLPRRCTLTGSKDSIKEIRWGVRSARPFFWVWIRWRHLLLLTIPWESLAWHSPQPQVKFWIAFLRYHLGQSIVYEARVCHLYRWWLDPILLAHSWLSFCGRSLSHLGIHKPEAPTCFIFCQTLLGKILYNLLCNASSSTSST